MAHETSEHAETLPTAEGGSGARGTAETRHTREQLLDAALELFAERGFEATPTKLIAERAGVPNGLIYYYFGTKEKLLEALFTERTFLPKLQAHIKEAFADGYANPRLTLIQICTDFYAALQHNAPFVRILSHEAGLRPVAHTLVRQLAERVTALLEMFLNEAQRQGTLRALDSAMVAHALFASIMIGTRSQQFSDPRAAIERLVTALLGGTT